MATRTISTKLAITGEAGYRASVTRINSEIKTLQSALKLTNSQFQNNANSMDALSAKGNALNALILEQKKKVDELKSALANAQKVEMEYAQKKDEINAKIKANNEALEELKNTTGDTSEEQARLTAENKELETQLNNCEDKLDASQRGVNTWRTQLNNAEAQLNNLDAELKLNGEYLEEARNSADGCATSIDQFGKRTKSSAEQANELRDALAAVGVIAALKATADALIECAEASIEFESAMAGVQKTTDLSKAELGEMADAIQELSTRIPATTTEIAGVAEAAGQLGIAKEDILSFAEVMVNLGVATNLTSTEASSALAKFANVVGMSSENYERLGSTIVDLGNNFATTEADIVSMATRLSSTGAIVGLTEPQIMAIATALSSVGIEAEAGGSAISKLLKSFETMVATGSGDLQAFAAVAGMSADEFSAKWGEDAVGALALFIDGLGAVDDAGGSSVAVLDELGVTEVRLSNAVLALSSSHGILNDALETAEGAWEDNTALAKEAATRYETTESKLQMLSNSFNNVKIAIGDQLTPALGSIVDTGAGVLDWAADVIDRNEALVPLLTATATAIGVMSTAIVVYTAVQKLATAAAGAFTKILAANPIFITVAAVAALATGIGILATSLQGAKTEADLVKDAVANMQGVFEETEEKFTASKDSIEGTAAQAQTYITRLKELENQSSLTTDEQQEYTLVLDKLKAILPDLNYELDIQTGLLLGGADSIEKQVDAWKRLAVQQALQEKYTAELEAYAEAEATVYEGQQRLVGIGEELESLKERELSLNEKISAAAAELDAAYRDSSLSMEEQNEKATELQATLNDLNAEHSEIAIAIADSTSEQNDLNAEVEKAGETAAQYNDVLTEAQGALNEYSKGLAEANQLSLESQSEQEKMALAAEGVSGKLQQLAQDYSTAYDAAKTSLDGQFGLWEEVGEVTDTSLEKMQAGIDSQAEYYNAYNDNLQALLDRNIEGIDKFATNFSDGSAESAAALAALASASDEEIQSLVASMEGLSAIKDGLATTFAGLEVDLTGNLATIKEEYAAALEEMGAQSGNIDFSGFTTAVATAFADSGAVFSGIGEDAGAGLQAGIDGSIPAVTSSANNMGDAVIRSMRTVLGINSPSRITKEMGENLDAGLAKGIDGKVGDVRKSVTELGKVFSDDLENKIKATTTAITAEFGKLPAMTKTKMAEVSAGIRGEFAELPDQMYSVGAQIVNGMISGMNGRSSSLYYTITRITNNAIANARSAAATASPSKKTTKIFEDVGEGMVVGLEHKREKIADTAQSVVDDALDINTASSIRNINDSMPDIDMTLQGRQSDSLALKSLAAENKNLRKDIQGIRYILSAHLPNIGKGRVYLDKKAIVGEMLPDIDSGLEGISRRKERGL